MPDKATKADIKALLERFETPMERMKVDNWERFKVALAKEATAYGLKLPGYLDAGAKKSVHVVVGGGRV